MFSYLVDTGHNNYTESFHEYLQHMMLKKRNNVWLIH
jgi:hypothetical protein